MVAIEVLITKHALQRAVDRGVTCKTKNELRELVKSVHSRARLVKANKHKKGGVYAAKEVVYAAVQLNNMLVVKTVFGDLMRYNWERSTRHRQIRKKLA